MNSYKIVVAYDGTSYYGWQYQPDLLSVAELLTKKFKQVFGRNIKLKAASRTDAGVHALGQVACFSTDLTIDPQIMLRAWNGVLPKDVLIRKLEKVDDSFNPQLRVRQKTYYYHFFTKRPLPLLSRYGFYYRFPLNLEKLKSALALFTGTHDFRSFCTGYEREMTIRTIDEIKLVYLKRWRCYRIIIKGPGFLKYMIRRIVGACLQVASTPELTTDDLVNSLNAKHPEQPYTTAPAHGLLLYAIRYRN